MWSHIAHLFLGGQRWFPMRSIKSTKEENKVSSPHFSRVTRCSSILLTSSTLRINTTIDADTAPYNIHTKKNIDIVDLTSRTPKRNSTFCSFSRGFGFHKFLFYFILFIFFFFRIDGVCFVTSKTIAPRVALPLTLGFFFSLPHQTYREMKKKSEPTGAYSGDDQPTDHLLLLVGALEVVVEEQKQKSGSDWQCDFSFSHEPHG